MGSKGDSSSSIQRILILGDNFPATPIIHALSHSPKRYEIHIAHPHSPTTPPHENTAYHTIRINPASLSPLLHEISPGLVIDTISGSFDSKRALIDCLVEAGILRFIPSEFGQDSLNAGIQDRLPAYRERAKTIDYLRQLSDNGKLTWSAAACGTILDRGLLSRNLGFDLSWRNATMHGSGDEKFAASSSNWIGKIVLAMLDHWNEIANQYLYAPGLVTSANEVLRSLEAVTGSEKPWTADRGDIEQCVREARQRIERGFPDAGMFLMERSVLYDSRLDAGRAFEKDDARPKLGLSGENLHELVKAVVHEHEHHGGKKGGCGCD